MIDIKNILIIINFNDFDNTNKLINNVGKYKIIDKIVIVDNKSKDEEFEKIKKLNTKKIDVIQTKENKGYGYAINFATKYIEKEYEDSYLIISNSDIIIKKEEDIKKLIQMLKPKKVAIVAPMIEEKNRLNIGWKIPKITDAIIMNIPKINKWYEKKFIKYNEKYFDNNTEVEVVSGCFFITKSSILKEIGYFDENIFLYYEENVIAYKLKKYGYKSLINKKVKIIHNHSQTIDKNFNKYKKLLELKKSQYYFYKNILKTNKFLLAILNISNKFILQITKIKSRCNIGKK